MVEPMRLPEELRSKVLSFPEYKMGAHRVALLLRNGETVDNVIIAWGDEIVHLGGRDSADVSVDQIADVVDRSAPSR